MGVKEKGQGEKKKLYRMQTTSCCLTPQPPCFKVVPDTLTPIKEHILLRDHLHREHLDLQ